MHLCKSDKKYNFLPIHKNHHSPIRPLNGVHLQPVCPRSGRGARLGARPALRPPPGDADSAILTAPGERRVLYLVDDGHGSTQSPLLPPCLAHALSATLPLSGWRQLAACPGHVCTCVSTQLPGARSSALPPLQGPAPAVAGDSHSASQAPFGEGTPASSWSLPRTLASIVCSAQKGASTQASHARRGASLCCAALGDRDPPALCRPSAGSGLIGPRGGRQRICLVSSLVPGR